MKKLLLFVLSLIFVLATLNSNAQYTKLFEFSTSINGGNPKGDLISDGTFLYGMAQNEGTYNNQNLGVIFKIKPDGTGYSKLLTFANDTIHGSNPNGSLFSDGTFLYGMTLYGGTNNLGTVFKIKPDGTGYVKLLDFAGIANGSRPSGSLISDGIFLYGMTTYGGTNNTGVIFKIKPDGTGYVKLLDFTGLANGNTPFGSLIFDGTFLYGMTQAGGANSLGTIFKIKSDGTGYSKLLDFAGIANGSYPSGSLISDGIFLYGMAQNGGTNNDGVIFKIKSDGTGYSKLLDFAGIANGGPTLGSLIIVGNFLYGMTGMGGTNNLGTIFKIKSDGTGYSKLLDFAGIANGSYPSGSLISDGIFLYGMAQNGGTNNDGVIFKIKSDGTGYSKLLNFAGSTNGSNPNGSLISDGTSLYGMTLGGGGTSNLGTIFKYQDSIILNSNAQPCFSSATNFAVGANPQTICHGDFNGDSKMDLATANYSSNDVSVLMGNGLGNFGTTTNFAVGASPYSVTSADFNGDGKMDLATANAGSNNVSILISDGLGSFYPASNFAVGSAPFSVCSADFNGDGIMDLATANAGSYDVSILLGNGNGIFGVATNFAVGNTPYSVTSADFNGDGKADLVVTNYISNNVSILIGNGLGGFAAATNFAVGTGPWSVTSADFNGDGKMDLAIVYASLGDVSILIGNGSGSFSAANDFAVGSGSYSVASADFNGDGKKDLAIAGSAGGINDVYILIGNGAGGFSTATNFAIGTNQRSVSTADFNGDGKADLAMADYNSNNASVLLNCNNICNITLSISKTDASCNGCSDGTATATPGGGSTPYTYLWSNGQTTQTATGLVAGSYSVTVTDVATCTATWSVAVNQPALGNGLDGYINDISVNFTNGTLDSSGVLNNVSVKVYQGSSVISSTTSNSIGYYQFAGLPAGTYTIEATYTSLQTINVSYQNITVPTSKNIRIPYSLLMQLKQTATDLKTYTFSDTLFYNLLHINFVANGYNETCPDGFVNTNLTIQNNEQQVMNSLGRLYIAQKALREFSIDGALMTAETVVNSYGLGEALFNLCFIEKKVENLTFSSLLNNWIKNIGDWTKDDAIKLFKDGIIQGCNCIKDDNLRSKVKAEMEGVIDEITQLAKTGDLNEYVQSAISSTIKNLVTTYLSAGIYGNIFVPQTQYVVDNSCSMANSFSYTGTFDNAYNNVIDNIGHNSFVEVGHQRTNNTQAQIIQARNSSNVAAFEGTLATKCDNIIHINLFSQLTSFLSPISSIIQDVVNVPVSGYNIYKGIERIYGIGLELPNASSAAFLLAHQDNLTKNLYSAGHLQILTLSLSTAISIYNTQLQKIENKVNLGERDSVLYFANDLPTLDSLLQVAVMSSVEPLFVSAPFAIDSFAHYDSLFNYSVIKSIGRSLKQRLALSYQFIIYGLDSTTATVNDSLNAYINSSIIANNSLDATINNMLTLTANIPVPAHVVVKYSILPPSMPINSTQTIMVHYKNIGASVATGLYAKINCTNGFIPLFDSIYIGTVNAGAEADLLFDIQTPSLNSIGYYTVILRSPTSTSDGYGESIHTSDYIYNFTGVKNHIEQKQDWVIYPNPATGSFILEFESPLTETATVRVVNVLGEVVYLGQMKNSNKKEINLSDFTKGIYFVQVIDANKNMVNKKIVLQ